jgi:hypothetical protein
MKHGIGNTIWDILGTGFGGEIQDHHHQENPDPRDVIIKSRIA